MVEFYQGTSDTVMQRLCRTIFEFDKSWFEKCVPAAEEQIRQLENICQQYGYKLPKVYLDYLRMMGENDGGLLEREWDGEPNIRGILELFNDEDFDAREDLQKGLLLFSYHWMDANYYLRVKEGEDNPVVVRRENEYFAGSFEKYLFEKAFRIYKDKFQYKSSVGTSINSFDAVLKKYSRPCSIHGGTVEERMNFVRWLTEPFSIKETWFGDDFHYFSYDKWYALEINTSHSFWLTFSCNDPVLKEKADSELEKIFGEL